MLGDARITLKLYRFELLVTVVACLLAGAAATILGRQLASLAPSPDCIHLTSGGPIFGSDMARCPSLAGFSSINGIAGPVLAAFGVLPFFAGALVGSQLVAREVDHRTAQLAWSLATVRRRWLFDRVAPPLVILAITLTVAAVASAYLEAGRVPALQISSGFHDYGLWGPLLIFRGVAALGIGVLIGAVVGRVLPSLLLTGAICGVMFLALPVASTLAQPLVPLVSDQTSATEYPLSVSSGWKAADGRFLSQDEARALVPPDASGPGQAEGWLSAHFELVNLGIPGSRMPEVAGREAIALLLVGLAGVAIAALVLDRRRPY